MGELREYIEGLPLSAFSGLSTPRPVKDNKVRQWDATDNALTLAHKKAISARLEHAAGMVNKDHFQQALRDLHRILMRVDAPPCDCRLDWILPGAGQDYVRSELERLSNLIEQLIGADLSRGDRDESLDDT